MMGYLAGLVVTITGDQNNHFSFFGAIVYAAKSCTIAIYSITSRGEASTIFETRLINETRLLFECNKVLLI